MAFRQTTFHSVHTHNTFIGNTLLRHFVRVLFLLSLSPFISFFPFVLNLFIRIAANNLLESGCVCVLGQAHRHSYVLCGFGFQTAPNICLKCIHTDICPSFSVFSLEFFLKFYFVGFSFSCACLFVCLFWACISRVWCFFALTKNPVATFSSKCSILFCSALFCSMHIAHT